MRRLKNVPRWLKGAAQPLGAALSSAMAQSNSGAPAKPAAPEIGMLGSQSRFKGTLRFEGTLTVDGAIEGDITAPAGSGALLVVNRHAQVRGDIHSDSVLIGGKVAGTVRAQERVEIFGTGSLRGDIYTGDIMIQGGAEFQGYCHMLRAPAPAEPSAPSAGAASAKDRGSPGAQAPAV